MQAGLVEKPFVHIELVLFGASCTHLLAPLETWINALIAHKLRYCPYLLQTVDETAAVS